MVFSFRFPPLGCHQHFQIRPEFEGVFYPALATAVRQGLRDRKPGVHWDGFAFHLDSDFMALKRESSTQ